MKIIKTNFKDLFIVKGKKFLDKRGFFRELLIEKLIKKKLVFHVVSKTKKNYLRGLHLQRKNLQGKYISVVKGKIFDVAVDCRKKSKTFGKYYKVILSDKNCTSIYMPPGFAHGLVGLDEENIVIYHCTKYRDENSETGIKWNDKILNINWPIKKPKISGKDNKNISFKNFINL
jgi:dTDP-4-dehydrorhamnose 3,5-epimerase